MKRKKHYKMRRRRQFSVVKKIYCWFRYRVFSRGCNRRIKKPREVEWYLRHWWRRGIWQVKGATRVIITGSDYLWCKVTGRPFDLQGWHDLWNHEDDYYKIDKETGERELVSGYKAYPDSEADRYVSVIEIPEVQKKPNAVLDQYYLEQLQKTDEYLKFEDPVVLEAEAQMLAKRSLASVFEPVSSSGAVSGDLTTGVVFGVVVLVAMVFV